jgi:hypothetical protein
MTKPTGRTRPTKCNAANERERTDLRSTYDNKKTKKRKKKKKEEEEKQL